MLTQTRQTVRIQPVRTVSPLIDRGAKLLGIGFALLLAVRTIIAPEFAPGIQSWSTLFIAVVLQALPFLAMGVVISGLVAVFLSPTILKRIVPSNVYLGVPAAALAGVALPGCECASVPVSARLMSQGVAGPTALAFLVASPAINPVVLIATAVAFPNEPRMVVARFVASLLAATVIGWLWAKWGTAPRIELPDERQLRMGRIERFASTAHHDLLHAGSFLIIGAATTSTLQTIVPRTVIDHVAGLGVLSVLALALLAVVLAVCSEADAFIVAGLSRFSLTARLAFLVVGPMVDIKLVALHAGTFGRRFALRFGPLVFVVAVAAAGLVSAVLL